MKKTLIIVLTFLAMNCRAQYHTTYFTNDSGSTIHLQATFNHVDDSLVENIVLPLSPTANEKIEVDFPHAIATPAFSGGTLNTSIITIKKGEEFSLEYESGVWYLK